MDSRIFGSQTARGQRICHRGLGRKRKSRVHCSFVSSIIKCIRLDFFHGFMSLKGVELRCGWEIVNRTLLIPFLRLQVHSWKSRRRGVFWIQNGGKSTSGWILSIIWISSIILGTRVHSVGVLIRRKGSLKGSWVLSVHVLKNVRIRIGW